MGIKRSLLKIALRIMRARLKFGMPIYKYRYDCNKFAKFIYTFSHEEKDVQVDFSTINGIRCMQFSPPEVSSRVIFYLHCGSYIIGLDDCKMLYSPYASRLAKAANAQVLIPDYRVAPEYPFPAAGEDVLAAYMGLLDLGVNPQDISVMGDTNGGGLALALLFTLRNKNLPLPGSIVTLSATTDLCRTGDSIHSRSDKDLLLKKEFINGFSNHYLQGVDPKDPQASPFYGDYTGFPPMLMIVGGREIYYDDTLRVAEKAKDVGVDVTLDVKEDLGVLTHLFFDFIEEGKEIIDLVAAFSIEKAKK
jgi:monoterpene epsilon-lactone hydrolase